MNRPRFSLSASFVAFIGIGLLFDSLASIQRGVTNDLSRGSLSLTALLVLVMCVMMERPPAKVLLFTAGFYCWGLACLWVVELVNFGIGARLLLASIGVAIVSVSVLKPEPELIRSNFP